MGRVASGSHSALRDRDLGCNVYSFKGIINVACFKLDAKGVLNGSYAVALGGTTTQVSRFQAGRGTTMFVGKPSK